MKTKIEKKPFLFACAAGITVCLLITAVLALCFTMRYPSYTLSPQDLLATADFVNYTILEDGRILSTNMDPMIIIPLPDDHNDVKAFYIDISVSSGYAEFWAQLFLYDNTDWVIQDFWVKNGGSYVLNRDSRTDDFTFLRVDPCDIEQTYMTVKEITLNPVSAFLEYGLLFGLLFGCCTCIAIIIIYRKANRPFVPIAGQEKCFAVRAYSDTGSHERPLIRKRAVGMSDLLLCGILAIAFTASPFYISTGSCRFDLAFFFSALFLFVLFLFLAAVIRTFLERNFRIIPCGMGAASCPLVRKKAVFLLSFVIFFCWLPQLILLYPGTLFFDTFTELSDFAGFISNHTCLRDNNPFFDTLLIGSAIVPLASATGRWHEVIFAYVLLQSFIMSVTFAYTLQYAYQKLNVGKNAACIMLFTYCFLPQYPLSAQTIGKDSISVWLFVLFAVAYMEMVRTDGQAMRERRFTVLFTILSIVLILTKKTNVIIVLFCFLLLLCFLKGTRKELFTSFLCIIVVVYVALPTLKTTLNIYPGGIQESFSLPFQMTARYVRDYPEDISEEEATVIDRVLTLEDLGERYDPLFADPVKGYQQKGSSADYKRYLHVWLSQGLRHPDAYFHAACAMISGWFSWEKYLPQTDMDFHPQMDPDLFPEWLSSRGWSNDSAKALKSFYDNLYAVPLVTVIFTYGFYASILPAFVAATVCRLWKKGGTKYWMATAPTALWLLGCWLSPSSIQREGLRYLYPVVFTLPLLLMWCVYIYGKENQEEQKQQDSVPD